MPSVAHQTRTGQFPSGDPNRGATLTAPNKVLFTLSVHDATELALEFAKSPTDTGVVSQYPVRDLLEGHHNPQIQDFVNKRMRPLKDRLEDIQGEMEEERLIRMDFLDEASLFRIEERIEGIERSTSNAEEMRGMLAAAKHSVLAANLQLKKMQILHRELTGKRLTLRELDRFFTAVMEGTARKGQEAFSQFLIARIHEALAIPEQLKQLLELYISLVYGDQNVKRIVPSALAVAKGLFRDTTASMQREVNEREKAEIREDYKRRRAFAQSEFERYVTSEKERKQKLEKELLTYMTFIPDHSSWRLNEPDYSHVISTRFETYFGGPGGGTSVPKRHGVHIHNLIGGYVLLLEYPNVRKVLEPFLSARFAPPWRKHLPEKSNIPLILDDLADFRRQTGEAWEVKAGYERRQTVAWRLLTLNIEKEERPRSVYYPFVHADIIEALVKFLRQYGEGALVALVMLEIAKEEPWRWMVHEKNDSLGYNMRTHVPALVGYEPVEILLALDRLNEILAGCKIEADCARYYFLEDGGNAYADKEVKKCGSESGILALNVARQKGEIIKEMGRDRDDMQELKKRVQNPIGGADLAVVSEGNELIKTYLMRRACDIARYGVKVADITFPHLTLKNSSARISDVVSSMVEWLLRGEVEMEERRKKECMQKIDEANEGERKALAVIGNARLPENLEARVLSGSERQAVSAACREACGKYAQGEAVLKVIKVFVDFCELLAQPENRIKGRYVSTRTEADMVNEMARELVGLPKYAAYARITQSVGGEQRVWKGKIRTERI